MDARKFVEWIIHAQGKKLKSVDTVIMGTYPLIKQNPYDKPSKIDGGTYHHTILTLPTTRDKALNVASNNRKFRLI